MKKKSLLSPALVMMLAVGGTVAGCSNVGTSADNAKVTSITVVGNYKTEYTVGETFDATGLVIKATMSDGTERTLSLENVTFDKSVLSLDDTAIVVSYSVDEIILNYTINITVNPIQHHYGAWQLVTNPSLTETGVAKRVCTDNDGQEQYDNEVPCLSDTNVWTIDESKSTPSTHLLPGSTVYVSEYGEVSVSIPADTEHSYNVQSVEWTWVESADGYDVSAKFTCSIVGCGDVTASHIATIVKNTTPSTCAVAGTSVYTATVEFNGQTYTDTKTDNLELKAHNYGELIPETPATCDLSGIKAHYVCEDCHKIFIEVSGEKIEVTEDELVISALQHNYTEISVTDLPSKTTYVKGDNLDTTGLVVKQYCEHCKQWFETTDYTVGDVDLTTVGTKTVSVTVGEKSATFDVNVYEQIVDLTENGYYYDFDLSQSGSYTLATQGLNGKIVSINGQTEGFTSSKDQIIVEKTAIQALLNGKNYGDINLTLATDSNYLYIVKVSAVTKILGSISDLESIRTGGDTLDGYYILGSDLVYEKDTYMPTLISTWSNVASKGFLGIFDGRGHSISDLKIDFKSIFNCMGTTGIVRNVALINVQTNDVTKGVFTRDDDHGGTFENVFVSANNQYFVNNAWDAPTFKNVVFVSSHPDARLFYQGDRGSLTIQNVVVVGGNEVYHYFATTANVSGANVFATTKDLLASLEETNVFENFGSFTYQNKAVSFYGKKVVSYTMTAETSVKETNKNTTVEFTVVDATLALKEQIAGVSLEGNVLTIGVVDNNTIITVIATSIYDENLTKEIEIKVVREYENVDLTANKLYYEATGAENEIELEGEVEAVRLVGGDRITEGYTYSEGKLALSQALISSLLNGKAYSESLNIEVVTSADKIYKLDIAVVTKLIKTMDDFVALRTTGNTLNGYFVLVNDIVYESADSMLTLAEAWGATTTTGFMGIFDGLGHSITNLKVVAKSVFNTTGTSTIKNVAFINLTTETDTNGVLSREAHGTMFENVFVSTNAKYLCTSAWDSPNFKNVVFVSSHEDAQLFGTADKTNNGKLTIKNAVVVGGSKLYTKFAGANSSIDQTGDHAYTSINDMFDALAVENFFVDFGSITYADNAICYNGVKVVTPKMSVSCDTKETSINSTVVFNVVAATLSLKEQIVGVSLENNVLTIGVVDNGTIITVVATYDYDATITEEIQIKVVRAYSNVDLTANKLYYEVAGAENEIELEGEVEAIRLVGGDRITEGYTYSEGKLALSQALISSLLNGKAYAESLNIEVITSADKIYKLNIDVVTKAIKTTDDLKAIATTGNTLDGYYVLANNLDASSVNDFTLVTGWTSSADTGFIGIFDGRGYTISNIETRATRGFLGCVGAKGILRNIGFVNMRGNNYAIATEFRGLLDNVLIASQTKAFVIPLSDKAVISNCVMYLNGIATDPANVQARPFRTIFNSTVKAENNYSITRSTYLNLSDGVKFDPTGSYCTNVDDLKTALNGKVPEGLNKDIWMIKNGLLVLKSVADTFNPAEIFA